MKANRTLLLIILLLTGYQVNAQENLEKWIKKCENDKSIDIDYITNNHSNDEQKIKITHKIIRLELDENSDLVHEFTNALNKDKDKATRINEKKIEGIVKPTYCEFFSGKENSFIKLVYSINYKKNGKTTITQNTTHMNNHQ